MKKLVPTLLIFVLILPAIALACQCCPFSAQSSETELKRQACHSCCPETIELARDCATTVENQKAENPQGFRMLPVIPQTNPGVFSLNLKSNHSLIAPISPPGITTSLPLALRI